MAKQFDLVVRGGTVADGTGAALHEADIAVKDGKIAAVGKVSGQRAPRRSTPRACWSRRASSTSTRTMTARRPGIRICSPRAGTASPRR